MRCGSTGKPKMELYDLELQKLIRVSVPKFTTNFFLNCFDARPGPSPSTTLNYVTRLLARRPGAAQPKRDAEAIHLELVGSGARAARAVLVRLEPAVPFNNPRQATPSRSCARPPSARRRR